MAFLSLSPQGATLTVDELTSAATHIGLFSADPIAAGNLASEQPAANGYARQSITWSTLSAGVKQNSADILWEAQGAAWNQGPWYIVLMSAATSGDPLAIVVDEQGVPQTTFDIAGVNGLQDTQRLKIPANGLLVGAGLPPLYADLDPVAEVLAMGPTLFWLFDRYEYDSVQLLYQDDAATTPVTSNGDPVGCAKDLVLGRDAIQSTSGRRPTYAAGVGIEFARNGELIPGDLSDVLQDVNTTTASGAVLPNEAANTPTYAVGFVHETPSSGNRSTVVGLRNGIPGNTGWLDGYGFGTDMTSTVDSIFADDTYLDQRLDVIRQLTQRGFTYCAQSGEIAWRNAVGTTTPDNVCFGNYQPGNGNQQMTGTISYVVFFDRLLNIPELSKLQQMLMRIGV